MNDRSSILESQLVAAAEELLAERNVTAVTARQIARRAGLSDGVLYNYFEDKSELLLAALVQRFERLATDLEQALPVAGEGTVRENLLQLAEGLFRFQRASLPLIGSVVADPALLQRFMKEIHEPDQYTARVRKPVADYLRAEQRAGRISAVAVGAAADLLIGGTAVLALNGARARSGLRHLTAILMNGMEDSK